MGRICKNIIYDVAKIGIALLLTVIALITAGILIGTII